MEDKNRSYGLAGRIARAFIKSPLTPLMVLASLLLGLFAVLTTPRDEEPQIVVPMIDIIVPFPGSEADEVDKLITKPLEKIMWEIPGVDYVYSYAGDGFGVTTVRFYVGEDPEDALVRLYSKLMSNYYRMPQGAMEPIVKPKSIDDVPILALTFYSDKYSSYEIRRVVEQVEDELKQLYNISETTILGSKPKSIYIYFDPSKLNAYHILLPQVVQALQYANSSLPSGEFDKGNYRFKLRTGQFLNSVKDVENVVIGVYNNKPIYIKDVAKVEIGEGEVTNIVQFGYGIRGEGDKNKLYNAVTLAIAKKTGSNAVVVAEKILEKLETLKGKVIPADIHVKVTRNYGETATEKANELIEHLLIATFSIVLLIAVTLGWRESLIVAVTIPVTLAIALFLSEMYGYSLNRVTLFALIFSIGILVDNSIVVLENIHRWFSMRKLPNEKAAIVATDEVGNPTILATFAVIVALLPMAFVSGLMGPYMRPIPINASVAMFFSMLIAFILTPYLALRWLKHDHEHESPEALEKEDEARAGILAKLFERIYMPLFLSRIKRYIFLGFMGLLLVGSVWLFVERVVLVKMLPYDNKSELFVVLDMPEGTPLEKTYKVAKEIAEYAKNVNEVENYVIYAGIPAPFDFNGLVRHYYMREGTHYAMIKINLIGKHERKAQSHQIAERIRGDIERIAKKHGAKYVAVVEPPPGPPVLSPIVAEVYGPDYKTQLKIADEIKNIFEKAEGVIDVGIYANLPQRQYILKPDREKIKRYGFNEDMIVKTVRIALAGYSVGFIHSAEDLNPVNIVVRLDEKYRTSINDILSMKIPTPKGAIPLGSLVTVKEGSAKNDIYRKNLQKVVYVIANVDDTVGSPVYPIVDLSEKIRNIKTPDGKGVEILLTHQPHLEDRYYVKWDGEWQVTYETFRDMGIAFAVALIVLYILLVGWFGSFKMPMVIMSPIPFTLVGIVPGHFIMGAFFTATSMIGFIALAGIILRNSILLVEFTQQKLQEGYALEEALLEAGIVRTRPILLTAAAVVVGAFVIIFDPIFNGLAIALIFGTIASTLITLVVVPVLYYMIVGKTAVKLDMPPAVPVDEKPEK
ncbi:MAG TPA: AcrB/AcrD/AcrF family protein [Persephonella sp.]|uniref:Cation efflux system n=1 Tax=Persephonella marina (strain DSM 14350 / EX-H1) TaxID=123214 RepID=C0QRF3_PERMH|nr:MULTISPECIES: efflux RND transporter permease subunit [Persephonella]ACO04150.1 cation efflux system [Persephonella marina EX-H1]HCB68995.1 AcrB/AcrD/AcrF family protein [Persephonella sp.]